MEDLEVEAEDVVEAEVEEAGEGLVTVEVAGVDREAEGAAEAGAECKVKL